MAVDVTWLGHSTVTVDVRTPRGALRIVTDPVLRRGLAHLRRRPRTPSPAASAGCDLALVSHLHHDHLDLPSLRRLRPAVLVTPPGSSDWVRWRVGSPSRRCSLTRSRTSTIHTHPIRLSIVRGLVRFVRLYRKELVSQ